MARSSSLLPRAALRLSTLAAGVLLACAAHAQTAPVRFDQAAEPLDRALNEAARRAGVQVFFASDITAGRRAPALRGDYTPREALERLLAGSGLRLQARDERTFTVEIAPSSSNGATALATVTVNASADASAAGLPPNFAGNQVARGGRVGLLGNRDIMETPFNTTAYTAELIQDQQARSVADVLLNDPSVRTARGFGNFQELYVIRGFPVYSDDMMYNGLYGLLPRQYVATEFLERVEVFRGANTFLNGAAPGGSGIGGAVNLLPKRAPNDPLTQITVGVESGGQAFVAADVARRFGPDNRLGVRINAARRDGDTAVDKESRELDMFSIGLDYRGDSFRLSADAGYQYQRFDEPRPSVTPTGAIPSVPDAEDNYAQPWTYSQERGTFGTFRAEFDFSSSVTAWLAAGMRVGREKNVLANPRSTADGVLSGSRFDNAREDIVRTGEVGMRGSTRTGSISHAWAVSASRYSLDSSNAFASGGPLPSNLYNPVELPMPAVASSGDLSSPRTTDRTTASGISIADTLGFMDDSLLLTLGIRSQNLETKAYDNVTGARGASYDKSAISPMVGVVYKLTPQFSAYANYIEGLQKGETAGTSSATPGRVLSPYRSKQGEIGLKYDGGKLGGAVAIFQTARPFGADKDGEFQEAGEQRNRGLEITAYGEPINGLRVLGGVTFLNAEQRKTGDSATEGKRAIGVPSTQLNLGTEWEVPGVPGLSLNARAIHTSSQYASANNAYKIPSWTRYDLGARYLTTLGGQVVTFRARVDNVTNKDYWASTGGYPNSYYLVQGAPRTFVLSATVDF
ncbi:TonB-dependent siderophore receptor [Azoarcus indigens]|uniref:Iron complex outermembrane receptor protein n=1 Tax=Azoarcus indigens TaxID=29545 RepID=A0A4R6E6Y2_9RHOO|nr:TonB-dependent receptor [Azoarcus indigens]NMG64018.1 TonB-dependent siderophore receptor [Azoarcus indigens]TDN53706.1 iron complex outermembrane receptor protein [Azoarcus indigens]